MRFKEIDVLNGSAACSKASGGFDIVCASVCDQLADLDLFLLGQVAGFNNDF